MTLDEEAFNYGLDNKFRFEEITCQAQLDGLLTEAFIDGAKSQAKRDIQIAYSHFIPGHIVGTAVVEGIAKEIKAQHEPDPKPE